MARLDECSVRGCTRVVFITYLGRPVCERHFEKHCNREGGFSLKNLAFYKEEYRRMRVRLKEG